MKSDTREQRKAEIVYLANQHAAQLITKLCDRGELQEGCNTQLIIANALLGFAVAYTTPQDKVRITQPTTLYYDTTQEVPPADQPQSDTPKGFASPELAFLESFMRGSSRWLISDGKPLTRRDFAPGTEVTLVYDEGASVTITIP